MMKKRAQAALTALLLFVMLCVPALAADGSRSFSFSLTSNGGSAITANLGSEFTLDFTLRRTDSEEDRQGGPLFCVIRIGAPPPGRISLLFGRG